MSQYGSAIIGNWGGRPVVESADDVIGISVELLAEMREWALWVGRDGLLWLAGGPQYRYRPVRFDANADWIAPGEAVAGARVLICERVR